MSLIRLSLISTVAERLCNQCRLDTVPNENLHPQRQYVNITSDAHLI